MDKLQLRGGTFFFSMLTESTLNLVKRIFVIFRKHQREYVRKMRFAKTSPKGLITDKYVDQIRKISLIQLKTFFFFSIFNRMDETIYPEVLAIRSF